MSSAKGRGIQLNVGARAARGDLLLFLHADSVLPSWCVQRAHAETLPSLLLRVDLRPDVSIRSFGDEWGASAGWSAACLLKNMPFR
jgi:hypothetical protein